MKRVSCIYEQMADWSNIVEAEKVSTKRKLRNTGVRSHIANRWENLTEIQNMVLGGKMRTDEYMHEQRISGQDKLRDIAKLRFHPSHIQHQLLTMAAEQRIEQYLIRHTYASRKGYGQIRCAMEIKKDIRKHKDKNIWYGQGDICKYYENTQHCLIRQNMEKLFKDKKFIDAFLEPFERFNKEGRGIPLGIRPSQIVGNLMLGSFDHFMTEQVKCKDYKRYLDDFIFLGETKGEVKYKMKRATAYLSKLGYNLHEPKIHRLSEGLDMMGFVCHGVRADGWWRKSDKTRWLKRRYRVTNPRRLKEIDYAAWGMLKWGNSHCRRLWQTKTGREIKKKDMVKMANCGIALTERVDSFGNPFIDAPKIGMQALLGKQVEVDKWIPNIKTSHGDGRYALRVRFMGDTYKLIVNAGEIKDFLADMTKNSVTRIKTVFTDRGSMHYGVELEATEILEVNSRKIVEKQGVVVFEDTGEKVIFV